MQTTGIGEGTPVDLPSVRSGFKIQDGQRKFYPVLTAMIRRMENPIAVCSVGDGHNPIFSLNPGRNMVKSHLSTVKYLKLGIGLEREHSPPPLLVKSLPRHV